MYSAVRRLCLALTLLVLLLVVCAYAVGSPEMHNLGVPGGLRFFPRSGSVGLLPVVLVGLGLLILGRAWKDWLLIAAIVFCLLALATGLLFQPIGST